MKIIIIIAIAGAGVITGLLFAFSNFVMRALAYLPDDRGMYAMQRINETIINPVFLMFFLGTPALCLCIAIWSGLHMGEQGSVMLCLGALAYLIGPFGITMLFNVPLNDRLARANPSEPGELWPMYQKRWQYWNHIRTYIGLLSVLLLSAGFGVVQNL